jgi:hypothetical protein
MAGVRCAVGAVLLLCAGWSVATVNTRSATPDQAILYTDSVNIIMSNGSLCVGERPGRAVEWTGHLSGCATQYAYHVRHGAGSPPRQVLRKADTAAASGPSVTVTDAKGAQHVFN